MAAPTPNWRISCNTTSPTDRRAPTVATSMRIMVSIYAIGSLEPLSSSSIGRRLWRSPTLRLPRMPKTDAESVDDMVAASSSEGTRAKWMLVQGMPESQKMNRPVTRAVTSTPTVESTRPGAITGRIERTLVDMPPLKRITHSATMPIDCATWTSPKLMPRPSTPKSMPTRRNTRSSGMPVR